MLHEKVLTTRLFIGIMKGKLAFIFFGGFIDDFKNIRSWILNNEELVRIEDVYSKL